MKPWIVAGSLFVVAAGGYALFPRTAPLPAPAPVEAEVASVPDAPPAPLPAAVLDRVVDVADIDHLLEPPPIPTPDHATTGPTIIRVGYEEPAAAPISGNPVPAIPKAATE